jgi:hypothetical protein
MNLGKKSLLSKNYNKNKNIFFWTLNLNLFDYKETIKKV